MKGKAGGLIQELRQRGAGPGDMIQGSRAVGTACLTLVGYASPRRQDKPLGGSRGQAEQANGGLRA